MNDFSGGKRAKYSSKLNEEERAPLLRRSASMDAQSWFGYAIQRVQELEALVVAYLILALEQVPEAAGSAAAALLEGQEAAALTRFASAVGVSVRASTDFESRIQGDGGAGRPFDQDSG